MLTQAIPVVTSLLTEWEERLAAREASLALREKALQAREELLVKATESRLAEPGLERNRQLAADLAVTAERCRIVNAIDPLIVTCNQQGKKLLRNIKEIVLSSTVLSLDRLK